MATLFNDAVRIFQEEGSVDPTITVLNYGSDEELIVPDTDELDIEGIDIEFMATCDEYDIKNIMLLARAHESYKYKVNMEVFAKPADGGPLTPIVFQIVKKRISNV